MKLSLPTLEIKSSGVGLAKIAKLGNSQVTDVTVSTLPLN